MDRQTVGSANRGRLQVEVRTEGRSEVVTPVGELDHHTADLLREPLESAVEQGRVRLVVDCSRLEFCDSTGLNVLLGARLKAEAAGEGSIWPECCRWWRGSSRSPGPRRSSPSTTPWQRLWTPDRGAACGIGSRVCRPSHAIRVGEVGVVTIRAGRRDSASPERPAHSVAGRYLYRPVPAPAVVPNLYLYLYLYLFDGDMVNR